jgi:hypothetical protein
MSEEPKHEPEVMEAARRLLSRTYNPPAEPTPHECFDIPWVPEGRCLICRKPLP